MTLDALASDIDNAAEEEAKAITDAAKAKAKDTCLLYTSPSPRDRSLSRMPSSA